MTQNLYNPRINYVIATWDGKDWNGTDSFMSTRFILDQIGAPKADQVLAVHLEHLSKLKHNLAQITIMKPKSHTQPKYDNYYTNAQKVIDEQKFSCPVVMVESDFYKLYSYGQWLYAYELYKNQFDYYIFVEDDTVGAIPNFDTTLVKLFHDRIPNEMGYLCTKTMFLSDDYYKRWDARLATLNHMAISTGITNSKTLALIFETYRDRKSEHGVYDQLLNQLDKGVGITNHPFKHGHLTQVNFSLLFTHTKTSSIGDYSDQYSCPFWMRESMSYNQHRYKEYGRSEQVPLIMPVTMIFKDDKK